MPAAVAVIPSSRRRKAGVVADDLGIVGSVKQVESVPRNCDGSLAEYDVLVRVDFNDLLVELVTDKGVAVLQPDGAGRFVTMVAGEMRSKGPTRVSKKRTRLARPSDTGFPLSA